MTRQEVAIPTQIRLLQLAILWGALYTLVLPAQAQQVTSTLPLRNTSDGFYETFGLHWGFRLGGANGGVFFDNGGFGGVAPPFGGFDPNAAARFGFARGGTNGGFFLDFMAGQGSNRSMVTQSPLLTLPNGGAGAVYNSSMTPFVTGWVPVVGQGVATSPLEERLSRMRQGDTGGVRGPDGGQASSAPPPRSAQPGVPPTVPGTIAVRETHASDQAAESDQVALRGGGGGAGSVAGSTDSSAARGDLSVAEIRRQQAAAAATRDVEIEALLEQARAAESQGKAGVARIFYQQAARRATGERQRELAAKARELAR